jgi:hypothetical protein
VPRLPLKSNRGVLCTPAAAGAIAGPAFCATI